MSQAKLRWPTDSSLAERASRVGLEPWPFAPKERDVLESSLYRTSRLLVLLLAWVVLAACLAPAPAASGNVLVNPGFEEEDSSLPAGWTFEERVQFKGDVSLVSAPVHSGDSAVRLSPNGNNTNDLLALNVGQGFDIAPLRGKTLDVQAWMVGEGGAEARFAVYAIDATGGVVDELTLRNASGGELERRTGQFDVPTEERARLLIISCKVYGQSGSAVFDDVLVEVTTEEASADTDADAAEALSADVLVDATGELRRIPRTLYGHNLEWSYGANGIYSFKTESFDRELIELTHELNLSLLRFPGGFFADFYHWREGVGPLESRPEAVHFPGGPSSRHTFGTDEAIEFAERTGTELLITVNAHTGTPEEAAAWVRYVKDHGGGRTRAPYWEIGNEFYIRGPNDPANASIPPQEYAERVLAFSEPMKRSDPSIRLLAIGGENYGRYQSNDYPGWNRVVLQRTANVIDFLAVHNAYFPALFETPGIDARTVYRALLAAPILVKRNLDTLSRQIDSFGGARASRIGIAVTEWGPIFHHDLESEWIHHDQTLGSALFVASTLKAFIESERTEVANAFKLNSVGWGGFIGIRHADYLTRPASDDEWIPTAPYFAMKMFTHHFGSVLVASSVDSPTYDSRAVGMIERVEDVPYLEVVSAKSDDGNRLYVMAINKHFDRQIDAHVRIEGFVPRAEATVWTLTGTAIDANTGAKLPAQVEWTRQKEARDGRYHEGGPGEITMTSERHGGFSTEFSYPIPALAVICMELERSR